MIGLACATLSCDGFTDNDFQKSFALLPKIGFRYVEFNCWFPTSLSVHKMRDIKRRCEDNNLIPAAVYGSGFGGADSFAQSKDVGHKLRLLEAAAELGCRRIVATGARRGTEGGLEAVAVVLDEVVPAAEEMDILICLENHAHNNLENIQDYRWLFERISSSHLGICLDTGHFDAAGVDMDILMDLFPRQINHIHIKENNGFGVQNFTMFGEGTTDNHHILRRMSKQGYHGYVTVELPPRSGAASIEADLGRAWQLFSKYSS